MKTRLSETKNYLEESIKTIREDIHTNENDQENKILFVRQRPLAFIDGIFKDIIITDEEIDDLKWERLRKI